MQQRGRGDDQDGAGLGLTSGSWRQEQAEVAAGDPAGLQQLAVCVGAELRPGLPGPGDVFATLQRVVDATLAVFQVDGASLALEHEDGSLRWVVVTDGAAGLLEDAQRDLGEGPGLAAYANATAVVVVELETDRRFERLAAAATQVGLHGVLAVPVALADRPVGALSVYATEPGPWSAIDVAATSGCR